MQKAGLDPHDIVVKHSATLIQDVVSAAVSDPKVSLTFPDRWATQKLSGDRRLNSMRLPILPLQRSHSLPQRLFSLKS